MVDAGMLGLGLLEEGVELRPRGDICLDKRIWRVRGVARTCCCSWRGNVRIDDDGAVSQQ